MSLGCYLCLCLLSSGSAKQKEDDDEKKGQPMGQLKKKVTQMVREKNLDKVSKESKFIVTLGT